MGNTVGSPLRTQVIEAGIVQPYAALAFGAAGANGCRENFEDEKVSFLQLPADIDAVPPHRLQSCARRLQRVPPHKRNLEFRACFAVFDGHGGREVAAYLKSRHGWMHTMREVPSPVDPAELQEAIYALDMHCCDLRGQSGATASFLIVERWSTEPGSNQVAPYTITIGNIGDSRTLWLRRRDAANEAADAVVKFSTIDHCPLTLAETQRIEASGGRIIQGRVDGMLNLSRALGDRILKVGALPSEPWRFRVCATADIMQEESFGSDVFCLCCDGIFEAFPTNESVADAINHAARHAPKRKTRMEDMLTRTVLAASRIVDDALVVGSRDNVTAIVVYIDPAPGKLEPTLVDSTDTHSLVAHRTFAVGPISANILRSKCAFMAFRNFANLMGTDPVRLLVMRSEARDRAAIREKRKKRQQLSGSIEVTEQFASPRGGDLLGRVRAVIEESARTSEDVLFRPKDAKRVAYETSRFESRLFSSSAGKSKEERRSSGGLFGCTRAAAPNSGSHGVVEPLRLASVVQTATVKASPVPSLKSTSVDYELSSSFIGSPRMRERLVQVITDASREFRLGPMTPYSSPK